nr:glycoside hydrolase domain-containing protein [Mycobacterium sp.]
MQLNAGPDEPYLWLGNEPGLAVPWLYNYLAQPWKTQEMVVRVRSEQFGPTPVGEPGNDDLVRCRVGTSGRRSACTRSLRQRRFWR